MTPHVKCTFKEENDLKWVWPPHGLINSDVDFWDQLGESFSAFIHFHKNPLNQIQCQSKGPSVT